MVAQASPASILTPAGGVNGVETFKWNPMWKHQKKHERQRKLLLASVSTSCPFRLRPFYVILWHLKFRCLHHFTTEPHCTAGFIYSQSNVFCAAVIIWPWVQGWDQVLERVNASEIQIKTRSGLRAGELTGTWLDWYHRDYSSSRFKTVKKSPRWSWVIVAETDRFLHFILVWHEVQSRLLTQLTACCSSPPLLPSSRHLNYTLK